MAWKPSPAVSHTLIAMIMSESPTTVLSPGHLDSVRVQTDTKNGAEHRVRYVSSRIQRHHLLINRESFRNMTLRKGKDRHLLSVLRCLAIP